MDAAPYLGLFFGLSEVLLRFTHRSKGGDPSATDRATLRLLWITIVSSIVAAIVAARMLRFAHFPLSRAETWVCVGIFWAGIAVRWTAIITLGRFFTVEVAIQRDHRLIRHGLYRWVRHPSYTGMMLAFLGYALTIENWISLAAILVPISFALARRIEVEEAALSGAFGEEYSRYQANTKRLIPGVY